MTRSMFSIAKPTHNIFADKRIKRRKAFKTQTKKKEWMKAGGHDPDKWRSDFIKTSKCRKCHKKLNWNIHTYDFDHKYNNSGNNSGKNCFLVCVECHRKVTKRGKNRLIRDKWSGLVIGSKATMRKVGYKKRKGRSKQKRKKPRRQRRNQFGFQVYREPKFKIPRYF